MKRFTSLSLIGLTLVFISCQKEDSDYSIQGKWNLEMSIGGLSGTDTLLPTESTFISFLADNKVILKVGDSMVENSTYKIAKERSFLHQKTFDFLTCNWQSLSTRYIIRKLDNNSLILEEDVFDGYMHFYYR